MMFTAEITGVVVTDSKLFNRTGAVGSWATKVEAAFTAHAIAEAPIGTDTGRVNKSRANAAWPVGSLKANIHGDVDRVAVRQLVTTISSDAPYSLYVIKGTGDIYSKSARGAAGSGQGGQFLPLDFEAGQGMYIPANPGWGKSKIRRKVSGQRANNFLARAFDATARTHSSLRGHSMVGSL
jgi:hypothetical protein